MPSVSSVELTNTFDDWRNRTNDVITVINGANSVDPSSAVVYANSTSGFQVNEVVTDSITGTLTTGTRLVFTGGNINFSSANTTSLGNVHQTHILGGTAIDVSIPENADTSISNTFIYNSKINLNGQKFISGAATIDLENATVTNLGSVAKFTATATSDDDVVLTNPTINVNSGTVGGITVSAGIHEFGGATVNGATMNTITMRGSTVEGGNVVVNGAGFLVTTNSVALAVDGLASSNVGIGKFPEISTDIGTTRKPNSSKGRLHIRTDFAAGGTTATAVESVADELILENTDGVGMTFLSGAAKNNHIMFGNSSDPDAGSIVYNHTTDTMHLSTDTANTVVIGNEYGGYLQVVGGDTVAAQSAKFQVTVGSTDGPTSNPNTLHGIFLDADDADQKAFLIDGEQTVSNILEIQADALTTGSGFFLDDGSSSSGARKLAYINQSHAEATGGTALHIETQAMKGVNIIQNCTSNVALNVSASGVQTEPLVSFINSGNSDDLTLYVKNSRTDGGLISDFANTGGSVIAMSANGNIGINDATPTYKLDVNGTVRFTSTLSVGSSITATTGTHTFGTDVRVGEYIYHDGDTDTYIRFGQGATGDILDFVTGGDRQLYMDGDSTHLYFNGNEKLATTSAGLTVTGTMSISGSSVCADGVECRLKVLDSSGSLINSC